MNGRFFCGAVVALPFVVATLSACNGEEKARYKELGDSLKLPVVELCKAVRVPDAGSCLGDCAVRRNATQGRALAKAGVLFAVVPTFADAETEALVADVRQKSQALNQTVGVACNDDVAKDAPVTLVLQRCADAKAENTAASFALVNAVTRLASETKKKKGYVLPNTEESCKESR